jgi:hypothetical protein
MTKLISTMSFKLLVVFLILLLLISSPAIFLLGLTISCVYCLFAYYLYISEKIYEYDTNNKSESLNKETV